MFKASAVFGAWRQSVLKFGVDKLAQRLRIKVGVLYGKLNPHDDHHKPTLADFVQTVEATGDIAPMSTLCAHLHGSFVPLPDLSHLTDNALLEIVNRIHAEGGDVFRALNNALAKGHLTADDSIAIDKEMDDYIAAILELRARVHFMAGRLDN